MLKFFRSALLKYSGVRIVGFSELASEIKLTCSFLSSLVHRSGETTVARRATNTGRSSIGCSLNFSCNNSFVMRPRQSWSASPSSFGQAPFAG
jgi:hypothetical protein